MEGSSPRRYQVILDQEPRKVLRKLPAPLVRRLLAALHVLETDPRPHGCVKLTGHGLWRIRVGEWRVIYAVEDDALVVLVVELAPRSGAYRNL